MSQKRGCDDFDPSFKDICYQVGVYATDIDMVFFDKDTMKTICVIDFKHNGITGGYPNTIIEVNHLSLRKQRADGLAHHYAKTPQQLVHAPYPVFEVITFTKAGEQDIPMFFMVPPPDELSLNKFLEFCASKGNEPGFDNFWLTPKLFAELICFVAGKDINKDKVFYQPSNGRNFTGTATMITLAEKQKDLSTVFTKYKLPRIVCSSRASYDCDCKYCTMSQKENKRNFPPPQVSQVAQKTV